MFPCPRVGPQASAASLSISHAQDTCAKCLLGLPSSPRGPGFPQVSLPVVEGGTAVGVKVKGVVDKVLGHSTTLRMMVPLFPQMAIKQAPSPSVVL